ncbi:hypothetical protein AQPW35_21260 [Rubrivivax pictus]|uniref:Uncharacterized protein n=1 Tax=Pseudaquabacterium pictum TaxID=2315236 RepID=A0A480ATI7_9BURK|nr:hypothetical protein AQPW35_21260 [Rubrivivax pictus]
MHPHAAQIEPGQRLDALAQRRRQAAHLGRPGRLAGQAAMPGCAGGLRVVRGLPARWQMLAHGRGLLVADGAAQPGCAPAQRTVGTARAHHKPPVGPDP